MGLRPVTAQRSRRVEPGAVLTGLLCGCIGFLIVALAPGIAGVARPVVWEDSIVPIQSSAELDTLLTRAGARPVLLEFYSPTCGACRSIAPQVNRLAKEGFIVAVSDIDRAPGLAKEFNVQVIPLLVAYRERAIIGREQGYQPAARLRELLNR